MRIFFDFNGLIFSFRFVFHFVILIMLSSLIKFFSTFEEKFLDS